MTKLEQLIKELCPNGVEYRTLSEVASYSSNRIEAKEVDSTNYVGVDNLLPNKQGKTESNYVPNEGKLIQFCKDDILIGNIRPYLKKIWFSICDGGTNGDVLVIQIKNKNVVTPKYLYYVLSSDNFFLYDTQNAKGAKMPRGDKAAIMKYCFAIPPFPIQEEIVRILDTFTELTSELTSELSARKRQYEYYASNMFPSIKNADVEWIDLGDVATVTKLAGFEFTKYVTYSNSGKIIALRGLNVKNGHLVLDDVKYIDNSNLEMLTRSKLCIGDMLFTYVGTVGQVALIEENDKYYLAPNVALVRITDERFLPEYMMYYFLTDKFKQEQIAKLLQASSMQNIPMEKIRKFKLPLIDIEEQRRTIDILKRFDILCNDISDGLPAEIEGRRKQYEYYRDKLLSFKGLSRNV